MSQILPAVKSGPAPITLIDSHCHLEAGYYGAQLPNVMARARDAGVEAFVAVGASGVLAGAREAQALSQNTSDVFAALGIHPCEVHEATDAHMQELASLLLAPKAVALGEVGLDYYHDASTRDVQQARFKEFVAMAEATKVPLMLHIRDAHEDCLSLLDACGVPSKGAMIHCFTQGPDVAQAYLDRGLYLSIPGVVTFKNARDLQAAVAMIPEDRLLVETDCPYLAPVPMRGKQNEPAFVRHTVDCVAALRHQDAAAVGRACADNARRFFALGDRAAIPSFCHGGN
jgi:TatD DNase family protein